MNYSAIIQTFPLLIEFVRGTKIFRESEVVPKIPIVQNGPPGTFILFPDGVKLPLPTDQITFADDSGGSARVAFGGMSAPRMEGGQLTFYRVKDLQPAEKLSPLRGRRMTLEPQMVESVFADGEIVWPLPH